MKTREQIQKRIDELAKVKSPHDYELMYLNIALKKDESSLELLLLKYEFELNEDIGIVKALSWVLDKEVDYKKVKN